MPASGSLDFYQGDDHVIDCQLAPVVDCTGWTVYLTLRRTPTGAAILTLGPATITDGPEGQFRFSLPAATSASLEAGVYLLKVRRTDSGAVATLTVGTATVRV